MIHDNFKHIMFLKCDKQLLIKSLYNILSVSTIYILSILMQISFFWQSVEAITLRTWRWQ